MSDLGNPKGKLISSSLTLKIIDGGKYNLKRRKKMKLPTQNRQTCAFVWKGKKCFPWATRQHRIFCMNLENLITKYFTLILDNECN